MSQVQSGKHSETIDFMQTMLSELRAMAEAERCDMLAYLISMAEVEARDLSAGRKNRGPAKKAKEAQN